MHPQEDGHDEAITEVLEDLQGSAEEEGPSSPEEGEAHHPCPDG